MKKKTTYTTLFIDVGGVLLTNGWDHKSRENAAKKFHLDLHEMDSRHQMTFDTFEVGKLSLGEYLDRVVFYQKRPFTKAAFKEFMFDQSKPYSDMIDLVKTLKAKYGLKIAVVSNEGRELNEYRIKKFKLGSFVDFFISSCFVHFRKPDADIYRIALDIAQVPPDKVIYIEDRQMFIQVAEKFGIYGLQHNNYNATKKILGSLGLKP